MGYIHKGRILDNGNCIFNPDTLKGTEFTVKPEDDGLHIVEFNKGDFEWRYFDVFDRESDVFLKIVIHVGTDPLRTKIFPQLAVSASVPGTGEVFTKAYTLKDLEADAQKCHILIRDEIKIRAEFPSNPVYFIKIHLPRFTCDLKFTGSVEGWKPLGDEVSQQLGKKRGSFSWIVPVPEAKVEGIFTMEGKPYSIHNGMGYHDHNYIRIDKRHPLHLDELITKWYWGKCHADNFTIIFMDTFCRTNRILSLMVAENGKIIHSANNLMDCLIQEIDYDHTLGVNYPSKIVIRSTDKEYQLQVEFDAVRVSDRKDLLEDVNPIVKYLIKRLVSRPAYFGLLAKIRLRSGERELEGYGNFESMFFRDKLTS